MRLFPVCRGLVLGLWVSLIFTVSFCYCNETTVEVVGIAECADCLPTNTKNIPAGPGPRIQIVCKLTNGEIKTRGIGQLDRNGQFKVSLPHNILKDNGELKEDCYAQIHSISNKPCATHNGVEASKIIFMSKSEGKHTFGTTGKLKFANTCTSAFFWPYYNYPPLPKLPPWPQLPPHPWHQPLPKFYFPPLPPKVLQPPAPIYKKPLPPPAPIYKKPHPPRVPVVKKPFPRCGPGMKYPICPHARKKPHRPHGPKIKKPHPTPVPIFVNPIRPPVPIVKKPLPPPVPIVQPLPPPVPIYKKPLPPPYYKPIPPIYKKPYPPIPIIPFPKLPPLPKIPPTYFHHPKFGHWPPFPPYFPHP